MNIAIETTNLTCKFGDFIAVDKINLLIPKGKIYGFLGPNGSGKSTTIRMLCGILTPTSGAGTVLGYNILTQSEQIKKHIGYMSQKFSLYHELTVNENLIFFAGMYQLSKSNAKNKITVLLEKLNLTAYEDTLVSNLSAGIKQRVALACAILHEPKILFLDEPTGGVDPKSRRMFWNIIYDLAQAGTTILVTTHFMDEAEHCDNIGFIYNGKLVAIGNTNELKQNMDGMLLSISSKNPLQLLSTIKNSSIPIKDAYVFGKTIHVLVSPESLTFFQQLNYEKITPSMEDVFAYHVNLIKKSGDTH